MNRKCYSSLAAINIESWRKLFSFVKRFFPQETAMNPPPLVDYEALLRPPETVRLMKILNHDAFKKVIQVPFVDVPVKHIGPVLKIMKPYLLSVPKINPVQDSERNENKVLLLNPSKVSVYHDIKESDRLSVLDFSVNASSFRWKEILLLYDHYKAEQILKAILPESQHVTSFSVIGHILHLNLRDHHCEYKSIIGQVLLEKIKNIRTVVNKANIIDNTYRHFQMELLAGEPDMIAKVKENGVTYEFDFSSVYWNPRLSTEHFRIVSKLKSGDVLFDVFAGVGPFSIPAAKKRCAVYANDLNPESFKWMQHNVEKNKVDSYVEVFNMDGREFICNVVKSKLFEKWKDPDDIGSCVHVVMNLPASAVTFLDVFTNLCADRIDEVDEDAVVLPHVHCYCFVKDSVAETAQKLVEDSLNCSLTQGSDLEVAYVRHVAPNKEMMRVSFKLSKEILFGGGIEPQRKKRKSVE